MLTAQEVLFGTRPEYNVQVLCEGGYVEVCLHCLPGFPSGSGGWGWEFVVVWLRGAGVGWKVSLPQMICWDPGG